MAAVNSGADNINVNTFISTFHPKATAALNVGSFSK
jgi:hypothetical protein